MGFPGGAVVKHPSFNAGDVREAGSILGWEDLLKEGIATHSIILALRIPWTKKHGGLRSIRSQRVRHD